ncbi:MAG TPA: hypothetical protein VEA58_13180 [Anaerovoracaceae bacterium]|nr:hypothetical protein [Anaerovoracaceae bacterium]
MKYLNFQDNLYKAAERMMLLFPDWVTGKSEVMKQKYYIKYGERDYRMLIKQTKTRIMAIYLFITVLFIVTSTYAILGQIVKSQEINSIQRPEFGTADESVPIEVQMRYKNYELTKYITIKVKQKSLSGKEKLELLQNYKLGLRNLILGENKDLDHINKPLNLISRDPDLGITVNWTSDHPELISEKGEVDLIEAKDKQMVKLSADLTLDDFTVNEVYRLKIDTDAKEEDYERSMTGRLIKSLEKYAGTGYSTNIELQSDLGDGMNVQWLTGKESNIAFITILFLFTVLIVYFKRYDHINKEIKEAEESIIKDLPEFINKLVLLLNAGLVVSAAFSKITKDYETFYHAGQTVNQRKRRFLYEELVEMQKRVNQSNTSLIKELKEFSQRCGVREMVRLTVVISENWNKGSTLAEKLEGEGQLLWISRKKRAEEQGKLAETKLTFPLMILLLVLIIVTVAPALMEM